MDIINLNTIRLKKFLKKYIVKIICSFFIFIFFIVAILLINIEPLWYRKLQPESLYWVCMFYAEDNGAEFPYRGDDLPSSLEKLVDNKYFPKSRLDELAYTDPETDEKMKWLYYPHGKKNSKGEMLIIASPKPYKNKRVVVLKNATKILINEEDYLDFK